MTERLEYLFFRTSPRIDYLNGRHVHVFECVAGKCRRKNGRDVRQFLDTADAKPTSGLRWHDKNCWGDVAVAAADNTQGLESARLVLAKTELRDGSITAEFECIRKEGKLFTSSAYFNRILVKHAPLFTRSPPQSFRLLFIGLKSFVGSQRVNGPSRS